MERGGVNAVIKVITCHITMITCHITIITCHITSITCHITPMLTLRCRTRCCCCWRTGAAAKRRCVPPACSCRHVVCGIHTIMYTHRHVVCGMHQQSYVVTSDSIMWHMTCDHIMLHMTCASIASGLLTLSSSLRSTSSCWSRSRRQCRRVMLRLRVTCDHACDV